MPQRPTSDRDLNAAIALAAVREQFPALDCQWAKHLGSGWATDVYLVDDRYAARFPRNAEIAEWPSIDEAILDLVSSSLSSTFSVPKCLGRGKAGAHFPYDVLMCAYVAGVDADTAPVSDALATELGRALTRIHSISVDDARTIGLSQPEWDDYTGSPRFVHGDFRHGNIIVRPDTGRLVGVIDWGNAAIGDPAWDFMALVLWRGWEFMHRALAAYELSIDDDFLDRVRYHARIQALEALTDSIRQRVDHSVHLGWLRNAFSLNHG